MRQIPLFKVRMSPHAPEAVKKVLESGYIGQGEKVEQFESHLREYFGLDCVLTMNSATAAEHLALHLLKKNYNKWEGMKDGDEVLATALTCTASNWPILANNFRIKWVDVNPNNLNMDLDDLARKISPTTRAIMIVHWGGYPVDLDKVREIQKKAESLYGFKPAVIEDCAHALGSEYKGMKIGKHGNICTFSFQAIKHCTTGDGGLLVVPHENLYRRGKLLRWYGIDRETNKKDFRCEGDLPEWGFKFHMNDIAASIGIENFKLLEDTVRKHKENASYYNDELRSVNGVTLLEKNEGFDSAYWIYTLKVENQNDFMEKMKGCGIVVSRVHERNDKHSCVREFITQLPTLDKVIKEMICIPAGWWVSKEDREYIVDCIKSGW